MANLSQFLFIIIIYYTISTFSSECAQSIEKNCNTGKFCFWTITHISSLYLMYIFDYFQTLFILNNTLHSLFKFLSNLNIQFFFISLANYLLYFVFLEFVSPPEVIDPENEDEIIIYKRYQFCGILGKDFKPFDVVSCAIETTFSYSEIYFSVYLIFLVGFLVILFFFLIKEYRDKRRQDRLVVDFEQMLENVYMEKETLKKFYEDNKAFLNSVELFDAELRVFRDQFLVEFENCPNRDYNECSICCGEFEAQEKVIPYPGCKHNFHFDCLELWVKKNKNCPLCKRKFRESFVEDLCLKLDQEFMRVSERNIISGDSKING